MFLAALGTSVGGPKPSWPEQWPKPQGRARQTMIIIALRWLPHVALSQLCITLLQPFIALLGPYVALLLLHIAQ